LENEGLIKDLDILYADDTIHDVFVENIKMTRDGIEYVESKFIIEPTFSSAEKLRELTKKTVSWGWEQAKDIISRTLSEIIKK